MTQISPEENLESTQASADELDFFEPQPQVSASRPINQQGVFVGIGIGMAISVAGMLVVPRLTSQPGAKPEQTATASAQSVTVATGQQTSVARVVEATGTVAAKDLLPVLPQTTGVQIQSVLVDEGDLVKAGQVMAVLDNAVLQAQLNQAQAQLVSAQALVRQKQAAVGQAQASLAEARSNQSRYQSLARQGAISRQESESRNTTAATAQEQVRLAQADVSSAEAEVQSRRAQVQQLQTQRSQTVVRAPAPGVVAERIARVGDVTGTQKLFSIIRSGALELQVKLPAAQLPGVEPGATVQITSSTDPRVRLRAKVRQIAPLVDPQSRQATVELDLPPSQLLRPGMFLQAAIVTGTTQGLTVPADAVLRQQGEAIVYRLEGDHVQAEPVVVGEVAASNGAARVEIKQGLALGDRVVVSGAGFLKDGDRVRVVP